MNRSVAGPGLGALLAAAALSAGCRGASEPVRIGLEIAGRFEPVIALATDSVNAAGGIRGRRVEVVRDTVTGGTWDEAGGDVLRAQSIVAQGAVAVVGHSGSSGSLQAALVYNRAGIVQVVPTGTSRRLTSAGPWTFQLPPNDSVEGLFIAEFVREHLRARSAVVFYLSDEYGIGLRDGVRGALAGTEVRVLDEVRCDLRSDFGALVDAVVRRGVPDVVIVAGRGEDTGAIARRLRERGIRAPVVAGDGAHDPELVSVGEPATEGVYVVTFWLPGAGDGATQRLEAAVRDGLGREPIAADVMVYDALRLLVAVMREVGPRPEAVRDHLRQFGATRPRFRGLTGEIGFAADGGPPRLIMGVVRNRAVVRMDAPR